MNQNIQENDNQPAVDVAALAAQAANQSPPPAPDLTPDQIAAQEKEQSEFNARLAKLTEGSYNNFDSIKDDLAFKSKYNELLPKYQQLETAAQADPFANDLSRRVNDMFNNGADRAAIKRYMDIHFMDFDKMDPLDLIAHEMAMGEIPYTQEQIQFQLESKYPMPNKDDFEDDEAGYQRALDRRKMQISIDAKQSVVKLQGMQADMGDGKAKEQQQIEETRRAALQQNWQQIGRSLSESSAALSFSIDDAEKMGGKYEFAFNPPEVDHDLVSRVLAEQATAAGLPLKEESIPQLKEMHQSILWNLYRPQFMEAMATDLFAKLKEHFVQTRLSGKPPTPPPARPKKPAPKQAGRFPRVSRNSGGI